MTSAKLQALRNYLSRYCTFHGNDINEYESVKTFISKQAENSKEYDAMIVYAASYLGV